FYEYNFNNVNQLEYPDIRVKYTGKLVANGFVFDQLDMNDSQYDGKYMRLMDLILGWHYAFFPKEAIKKDGEMREIGGFTTLGLQQGSKIRVVIPSPWAYGNRSEPGKIPANSPLDFTIEVLVVKAPAPIN